MTLGNGVNGAKGGKGGNGGTGGAAGGNGGDGKIGATGGNGGAGGNVFGGGLVGDNTGAITNAYAKGNVTATAGQAANGGNGGDGGNGGAQGAGGGNVGTNGSGGQGGNGGAAGSASGGNAYAAGLLGRHNTSAANNVYSIGLPEGTAKNAGTKGFGGSKGTGGSNGLDGSDGSDGITTTLQQYIGGLVGSPAGGTYSSSYWNTATSQQSYGGGNNANLTNVTGKTTGEMMAQSTFTGWDFTLPIWKINEGSSYPYFNYQTVPGAPTGAAATSNENEKSAVSWNTPGSNGGSPITDYQVMVYNSSGGDPMGVTGDWTRNVGSATTTYEFIGLANGTGYTFKINAINLSGTSATSTASSVATPSTVPGAPTDANAASNENTKSTVSWLAPASNGGATITDYQVMVYNSSGGDPMGVTGDWTRNVGSATTTYEFIGLANGTGYTFKINAINLSGTSATSTASSVATPSTVPGAPTDANAASNENTKSTVSWLAPASNGGATITDYQVTVYNSSGGDPMGVTGDWTRNVGSATTTYEFIGLANGTGYTFKINAINLSGTSATSTASSVATPSTVPGAPTDANAASNENTKSTVSWLRRHPTAAPPSPITRSWFTILRRRPDGRDRRLDPERRLGHHYL